MITLPEFLLKTWNYYGEGITLIDTMKAKALVFGGILLLTIPVMSEASGATALNVLWGEFFQDRQGLDPARKKFSVEEINRVYSFPASDPMRDRIIGVYDESEGLGFFFEISSVLHMNEFGFCSASVDVQLYSISDERLSNTARLARIEDYGEFLKFVGTNESECDDDSLDFDGYAFVKGNFATLIRNELAPYFSAPEMLLVACSPSELDDQEIELDYLALEAATHMRPNRVVAFTKVGEFRFRSDLRIGESGMTLEQCSRIL